MWTVTFNDLPVTTAEGTAIVYTVDETVPEGYTKDIVGNAAADSFTITNTHTPEETTSVSVSKVWNDANDQDGLRPDSITVQLLANGMAVKTLTLSADNMWTGTFSDLPVNTAEGTAIVYTVDETEVPGYTKAIAASAAANGFIITNTHTPATISVNVNKVWVDANNQDGLRPASVTIKLLADGADTGKTVVLNAYNNWMGSFSNLAEYQAGKAISYSVREVPIGKGYTAIRGERQRRSAQPSKTTILRHGQWTFTCRLWQCGHDPPHSGGRQSRLRPGTQTQGRSANGNLTWKETVL